MTNSYLSEVCLNEVGFRGSRCTVDESCSAAGTGDASHTALDRVSITVPYSNASFQLQMLMSADNPQLAPDFIFEDSSFLSTCDAAGLESHLPALRDWRGSADLPLLLRQLLTAYKAHVVSRLAPGGSLLDSYTQLLTALGPDALEPLVASGELRPALFLTVRLPLDLTALRGEPLLAARPPPRALLLLKATEKGGIAARLRLSPALAALAPDCRLPPPAGRPLPEYVQLVTRLTQLQLQEAADGRRARHLLLAALAAAAPQRLLELSSDGGRAVLRWDGAVAELLLAAYPRRPPTLSLASTAGDWRRDMAVTLPDGGGVTQAVTAIIDKVEKMLKDVGEDGDSDESLI